MPKQTSQAGPTVEAAPTQKSFPVWHVVLVVLVILMAGLLYWKIDSDSRALRSEIESAKMEMDSDRMMMEGKLQDLESGVMEAKEGAMMEKEVPEQSVGIGTDFFMKEGERVTVLGEGEARAPLGTITLTDANGLRTNLLVMRDGKEETVTLEQGTTSCLDTSIGAINLRANSDTQASFFIALSCQ